MRTRTIGVMKPTAYLIRLAPMRKPALSESDAIEALSPSCGTCLQPPDGGGLCAARLVAAPARPDYLMVRVYASAGQKLRCQTHPLGGARRFSRRRVPN